MSIAVATPRPAIQQLTPSEATIPGVADGYGAPCSKTLVMGGVGQNHPYNQLEFDKDAEERAWWDFALPVNFHDSPTGNLSIKVSIYWIAETLTTGDVVWGVSVLGRKECEAWDSALGTEVMVTDTTHGTVKSVVVTEVTLTLAEHDLEANDAVVLQLARKVGEAGDNLAEDADVVMVKLDYAINPTMAYAI